MRRTQQIILIVFMLVVLLPCNQASAWFGKKATAIIVDDETGAPIEGAIALAQWVKYKPTLFEGGIPYAAKAKETVSDKEGKVYIKGYWPWNPFACDRHLTVYKPGYALWNSKNEAVYPLGYQPKDFSSEKNVVRLVPFEKAAEEWKKIGHSEYEKKNPRGLNYDFLGDCFEIGLDTNTITMGQIVRQYEMPFVREEKAQHRRAYESSKNK